MKALTKSIKQLLEKREHYRSIYSSLWKEQELQLPKLECQSKPLLHTKGYHSYLEDHLLSLEIPDLTQGLSPISQLVKGFEAKNPTPFIGEKNPKFSVRALWFCEGFPVELSPGCRVTLPHSFFTTKDQLALIASKLIEWGYNYIILGDYNRVVPQVEEKVDYKYIYQLFNTLGIKVIYKPLFVYSNIKEQVEQWSEILNHCDGLYYQSFLNDSEFTQFPYRLTRQELVVEEHHILYSTLQRIASEPTLFFEVPYSPYINLIELQKEISTSTHLVFSPVKSKAHYNHSSLDLVWNEISSQRYLSHTPLCPLINSGAIFQGEGLWPSLPLELFQQISQNMHSSSFSGVITLTRSLPKSKTILDLSLWVTAQLLWHGGNPMDWIALWCKASGWDSVELKFLESIRRITLLVSSIKEALNIPKDELHLELWRSKIEGALAELKSWEYQSLPNPWLSLFLPFSRDVKRLFFYVLQKWNISMGTILSSEDLKEGFWTVISEANFQALGRSAEVSLKERPNESFKDSALLKIFQDNNYIF
jgi:hypothetical protein